MKRTLCTFLLLLAFDTVNAQQTDNSETIETEDIEISNEFWKNIKIRQGFESEDEKGEHAIISITFPGKGRNSFMLNGAISYNLIKSGYRQQKNFKYIFAPILTLNRNNQVDKEQNNFKAGILNNFKLGKYTKELGVNYFTLNNSIQYQRDKIDTSHSLLITAYISQISSKKDGKLYLNTYKDLGSGFQYFLSYNLGAELQNKFKTSIETQEGAILRAFYSFESRLALKVDKDGGDPSLGTRMFELSASQTGRYAFVNATDNDEKHLPLTNLEFNFYPSSSEMFSIGLLYTSGSDPLDGLLDQDFYLLSARFKL